MIHPEIGALLGEVAGLPNQHTNLLSHNERVLIEFCKRLGAAIGVLRHTAGNPVVIKYTNHRHQTAERHIVPLQVVPGPSKWHPKAEWLIEAYSFDKEGDRTLRLFDPASIHRWVEVPTPPATVAEWPPKA